MTYALEVRELYKTYPANLIALNGINLIIEKGDFFGLLGPNGAGKSTFIGIISSLVNKSTGIIKIFGQDIDTNREAAKLLLGLVPQETNFNVFETVLDIVVNQAGYYGIPRTRALKDAEYYLKILSLWDKRNITAGKLSGGMKRRLMIARSLIHKPQILVLDEPTVGIDINMRKQTWQFLKDLNAQGTTIILTTHSLEEAEELCKNIAIIDKGKIFIQKTIQELSKHLDKQRFTLELQKPLSKLPNIKDYQLSHVNEHTIEVICKNFKSINELLKILTEHNILVLNLRNTSNHLAELFMSTFKKDNDNYE